MSDYNIEYSQTQINKFNKLLDNNKLPVSDIGLLISGSLKFRSFRIVNDNDIQYRVQPKPSKSPQTVNPNENEKVDYEAYIYDDNNTWYLDSDTVDKSDLLPELRQTYCEGDSFRDRESDYKYYFNNNKTLIAVPSQNPVDRLEDELIFSHIEFLGGEFPKKWLLATQNNDYYYLRERSGSIKLISDSGNGELIFTAYIGGEHPGTRLEPHEVLKFISSVDYISIKDNYNQKVPQEAHKEHTRELREMDNVNVVEDVEGLIVSDDSDEE